MNQSIKLSLISSEHQSSVPFNYLYLEFSKDVLLSPEESLDVINGRHPEKTFVLNTIQNTRASKIYLHKPVSRYEVKK